MEKPVIAIFASGSGSNAQRIIEYFSGKKISVGLVFCNNPKAGVLDIARRNGIETIVFNREEFYHSNRVLDTLKQHAVTHIVLAGFLWLIPGYLIQSYPDRIINIHPALLPKFGGKGMYGKHVHTAVKEAGENRTGITIHLVNENYDEGGIIRQESVDLEGTETPDEIGQKVQRLEHIYFPETIEKWILSNS